MIAKRGEGFGKFRFSGYALQHAEMGVGRNRPHQQVRVSLIYTGAKPPPSPASSCRPGRSCWIAFYRRRRAPQRPLQRQSLHCSGRLCLLTRTGEWPLYFGGRVTKYCEIQELPVTNRRMRPLRTGSRHKQQRSCSRHGTAGCRELPAMYLAISRLILLLGLQIAVFLLNSRLKSRFGLRSAVFSLIIRLKS